VSGIAGVLNYGSNNGVYNGAYNSGSRNGLTNGQNNFGEAGYTFKSIWQGVCTSTISTRHLLSTLFGVSPHAAPSRSHPKVTG
jgi:hypothetical protein